MTEKREVILPGNVVMKTPTHTLHLHLRLVLAEPKVAADRERLLFDLGLLLDLGLLFDLGLGLVLGRT